MTGRILTVDVREDDRGWNFDTRYIDVAVESASFSVEHPPGTPDSEALSTKVRAILEPAFAGRPTNWLGELEDVGKDAFSRYLPERLKETLRSSESLNVTWWLHTPKARAFPWELLHNGQEFLCRQHAIGRVLSIGKHHEAKPKRQGEVLILALPTENLDKPREEGEKLAAFFEGNRAFDAFGLKEFRNPNLRTDAGLEGLKSDFQKAAFVHFCGHSQATEDDATSGWILSDDAIFNLKDIRDLGNGDRVPAFVISNSCASSLNGGPPQDGLAGIAGAFLAAGVAGYVGTLCRVEDKSALEFAMRFYRALTPDKTLAHALLEARSNTDISDPAWAAYQFFGDGRFTLGEPEASTARGGGEPQAFVGVGIPPSAAPKKPWHKRKMLWALIAAVFLAGTLIGLKIFSPRNTGVIYWPE